MNFISQYRILKMFFYQKTAPAGAYELQRLNEENKSIFTEEGPYTKQDYPCLFKPKFSSLGSVIEISNQRPINSFIQHDSIRNILGFDSIVLNEKFIYHLGQLTYYRLIMLF